MRSLKLLVGILVLAALPGCEEKKPRYLDDGKDKTGGKMLASGEFIPPAFDSPQGAWRLTHIDGKPTDRGRIEFAKGWLSYSGGCNGAGGEYVSHPDGRLEIKNTSGHAVACYDADGGESGMALDDLIGERLGRTMKFQLSTRDDLLLTRPDGRSLRMKRLSRPPRSVEGDWALLNVGWNSRVGLDPRPTAHFHRGRYHDAVGCKGRFLQAFGFLGVTLEKTPACARSKLLPGFHRIRGTYDGVAFVPREDYRYMRLAPLSNWEVVPRSRWTLDGVWYGSIYDGPGGDMRYRLVFAGGRVAQWGTCQGNISSDRDSLTFVFPNTKACGARLEPLLAGYRMERAQLPPGATIATLKMRSYGEASLTFGDGKVLWLNRTEPKERRPASSGGP
jgi:heat shock protein HslJ